MRMFGEYLVEKGLIREEELLESLLAQIEEKPAIEKLVLELGLLNQRELLQTLKTQTRDQSSFIDAAMKLSLWTKEKSLALSAELTKRKRPLGEILVRKRYLELSALTRALDDFFEDEAKPDSATNPNLNSTGSTRKG